MKIVTIFQDKMHVLSKKAEPIPLTVAGFKNAKIVADQLVKTLIPLMPAAGLAAPQIGISKQIFVYSWDRSPKNIKIVINPRIVWLNSCTQTRWETCFSTLQEDDVSEAAWVTRAKSLVVEYVNLKGEFAKERLEGFAAKVFQHEYDHLQGIVNVKKEGVETKTFATKEKLIEFMKKVSEAEVAR